MTDERDSGGYLLPDAERLTKIGKIVRSLSIDELPQLINVLKGIWHWLAPSFIAEVSSFIFRGTVPSP